MKVWVAMFIAFCLVMTQGVSQMVRNDWVFPGMIQDKIAGEETAVGITNATVLEIVPMILAEVQHQFAAGGRNLNLGNYFEGQVTSKSLYYYENTTMEIINGSAKEGDGLIFHSMEVTVAKHLISIGKLNASKYKIVFIEGAEAVPWLGAQMSEFNQSWDSVRDLRPGSKFLGEINAAKIEDVCKKNNILEIHGKLSRDIWWAKYVPIFGADIFKRTPGTIQVDFPEVTHVQLLRNRAAIQTVIAYLNDPLSFSNFFKQTILYCLFKKVKFS